jgi:hypothetical protein
MTSEMSDQELQEYGRGLAASHGTGGPKPHPGIFVIGAIVVALACGLCGGPVFNVAQKQAETDRQHAIADASRAEAERLEKAADKAIADANAQVLKDYSELAKTAINADIRRSHPEIMIQKYVLLCCLSILGLVALICVLCVIWCVVSPDTWSTFWHGTRKEQ